MCRPLREQIYGLWDEATSLFDVVPFRSPLSFEAIKRHTRCACYYSEVSCG